MTRWFLYRRLDFGLVSLAARCRKVFSSSISDTLRRRPFLSGKNLFQNRDRILLETHLKCGAGFHCSPVNSWVQQVAGQAMVFQAVVMQQVQFFNFRFSLNKTSSSNQFFRFIQQEAGARRFFFFGRSTFMVANVFWAGVLTPRVSILLDLFQG